MAKILIDNILGGHSPSTHFSGKGQFRASLGIDPSQPIDDLDSSFSTIASGLLRPAACQKFSGTTITSAPLWLIGNPKDQYVYVLDANGSAYTVDPTFSTVTALADGGSLSGCLGNGGEYYDNYIYFFKNTDVCRYGPLNGSPAFNATYWTSTLGKGALINTAYPVSYKNNIQFPNHVAHRHSDGVLYFSDVVGNQGTIHTISTTKGSVEGDTNSVSTANKITFGYGLWPTAIESYTSDIAVALMEVSGASNREMRAKLAFISPTVDTIADSFNKIIWVEFPDQIITAMKNVNGILYVFSGNVNSRGFRITRFNGGYSFEDVFNSETGESPLPGAIDGILSQVISGSHTTIPESDGCVYGLGLSKLTSTKAIFNVMRSSGGTSSTSVTAVLFADNDEMGFDTPIVGWTQAGEGSTGASHGLDKQGVQYNNAPSSWWSEMYRIGKQFKIQKIRIPFSQFIATNMTLTVKVYTDDGNGTIYTYIPINSTNYPISADHPLGWNNIALRSDAIGVAPTGQNNFWIELRWTGSALLTVSLPIEIILEVIDSK